MSSVIRSFFNNLRLMSLIAISLFSAESFADAPPAPVCSPVTQNFLNSTAVPISAGAPNVVTSTIVVSGLPNFIWDLDLTTFIQHTFNGDLDITLTSPEGTVVTITSDNAGGNDNVFNGTVWDDRSNPGGDVPHAPNNGGGGRVNDTLYTNNVVATRLTPEEPLAAFFGENPNGTWILKVSDDANADGGQISSWALNFVALPSLPVRTTYPVISSSPALLISEAGTPATASIPISGLDGRICDLSVNFGVTHTSNSDIQAIVISPSGTSVTLTSNNGGAADNGFSNVVFSNFADPGNDAPFPSNTFAASNLVTDTTYTNLVSKTVLSPEESLGALFGEIPNGTWTIKVADSGTGETGTLNSWGLLFTTCRPFIDSDGDNLGDECDLCPNDANKAAPLLCGCGVTELTGDADFDGTIDCLDACVSDANKVVPGVCGCGVADIDANSNSVLDCLFNQELEVRSQAMRALVAALKPARSKKALAKLKLLKARVKSSLDEMVNYSTANSGVISVSGGSSLQSLTSKVKKAVLSARKLLSSKARKAAIKTLNQLESAL